MPLCQRPLWWEYEYCGFWVDWTCSICAKAQGLLCRGEIWMNCIISPVIDYNEDVFVETSSAHLSNISNLMQHIHSPCHELCRRLWEKKRERKDERRKRRQGLIWQFVDKPQDDVWESMSSQWTVLKSNSSQNQSQRPSICQFRNCFCMVSVVAGLSLHWFSIKAKHHIIIYWTEQIPTNVAYI